MQASVKSMMAAEENETQSPAEDEVPSEHERRALGVAKLLRPTIVQAVEFALNKSLHSIKEEMETQSKRLQEAKTRIAAVEEKVGMIQATCNSSEQDIKALLKKIDGRKNRSRSNLHIIGIPGSYNNNDLQRLCSMRISEAYSVWWKGHIV